MLNKNIPTKEIRSGMILSADAVDITGKVVSAKNTVLSPRIVQALIRHEINEVHVFIPDRILKETDLITHTEPEKTFNDTIDPEQKNFRKALLQIAGDLSEMFESLMINPAAHYDFDSLVNKANSLSERYGNTLRVLELLQSARDLDDTVYIHSVGVALISRIIGIKAQMNTETLHELVLSALFHDIGKMTISEDVLNKNGRLTEDELEEVRSHTVLGYGILSKTRLPHFVAECALYHHERYDGSGYPDGVKGDAIPLYASYVAIADVYYAMTSKRTYRDDICAFDVLTAFEDDGYQKYNVSGLLPFLNCIAQSQIGAHVILNNGSEGNIIMLNKRLTRPIIKVGSEFIDLSRKTELEIIKVV